MPVQSGLFACGAVREWHMVIGDIVEEVNLFLLQEKTSRNGVDRSITPPLVKEATILIKGLEEVYVRFRSQPVQVTDLEVGPLQIMLARVLK